jgi:hypothetical protein
LQFSERSSPNTVSIRRFRRSMLSRFLYKALRRLGFVYFGRFEAQSKAPGLIERHPSPRPDVLSLWHGWPATFYWQGPAQSSSFYPPFRGGDTSFLTPNPLIRGRIRSGLEIFFDVGSNLFANFLWVCLLCNSSAGVTRITYKIRRVLIPEGLRERWSGDNSENQQDLRE